MIRSQLIPVNCRYFFKVSSKVHDETLTVMLFTIDPRDNVIIITYYFQPRWFQTRIHVSLLLLLHTRTWSSWIKDFKSHSVASWWKWFWVLLVCNSRTIKTCYYYYLHLVSMNQRLAYYCQLMKMVLGTINIQLWGNKDILLLLPTFGHHGSKASRDA